MNKPTCDSAAPRGMRPFFVLVALLLGVLCWRLTVYSNHGLAASPSVSMQIDPNTANSPTLQLLPRIGPVLAEKIIAYRNQHPLRSIDQLQQVSGIGPYTIERIGPYLIIEQAATPVP